MNVISMFFARWWNLTSIQASIELVLVFKKKSRRVEDLETLFCEFSSFRPSSSFVKIIEFVRTLIGPFEPDVVIAYLSFIVRDGRQSRRRSE